MDNSELGSVPASPWGWVASQVRTQEQEIPAESWSKWAQSKTILLTGAAGSLGSGVANVLARAEPQCLILLDNDERRLVELERSLRHAGGTIECVLGDVGDVVLLTSIGRRRHPDVVIHTAALKHVAFLERHPIEAFRTNFLATARLLDHAAAWGAKHFIQMSTDKAVSPHSVLGLTKALADCMIRTSQYDTQRCSLRLVNVAGSAGSVLPLWQQAVRKGEDLLLRDGESTRWFMPEADVSKLIWECIQRQEQGETLIPKHANRWVMSDLLERFLEEEGAVNGADRTERATISRVGRLPGEKQHELLYDDYSETLEKLSSSWIDRVTRKRSDSEEGLLQSLPEFEEAIANRNLPKAMKLATQFVPTFVASSVIESLMEGAR